MSGHGPLFDEFDARASDQHGGSYFDRFNETALSDKYGDHFDENFRESNNTDAHGERWDRFDWKPMPALHGTRFDEGFGEPAALSGVHGSWFDAFKGGAMTRFVMEGADYEGLVIDCNDDYATVRTRDGQTVEVGFQQFLEYASPTMHQASPPTTRDHSSGVAAPRESVDIGSMEETFIAVKAVAERFDVRKTVPPPPGVCPGCMHEIGSRQKTVKNPTTGLSTHEECAAGYAKSVAKTNFRGVVSGAGNAATGQGDSGGGVGSGTAMKTAPDDVSKWSRRRRAGMVAAGAAGAFGGLMAAGPVGAVAGAVGGAKLASKASCPHCHNPIHLHAAPIGKVGGAALDVLKEMTSGETSVQGDADAAGAWCPTCKHACRHPRDGKCPTCGTAVTVGKVAAQGIEVPERSHPSSDHHMRLNAGPPGRCPHCGEVLDDVDYQTEQGQPSRKQRQGENRYDATATKKTLADAIDDLGKVFA